MWPEYSSVSHIITYYTNQCSTGLVPAPQDRLRWGCRRCRASPAPSARGQKASEWLGLSASSTFFLHAWNSPYWDAPGPQDSVLVLCTSLGWEMNLLLSPSWWAASCTATKIWKQHRGELLLAACATGVAAGLQFSLNSLSGSLLWVSLPYFIYRVW